MEVSAKLKYARISPQKCRLVADVVRGEPVGSALNTLKFMPKKGAHLVRKVLASAVANAEHNHGVDIDELKVSRVLVDAAPQLSALPRAPRGVARASSSATATLRLPSATASRTNAWARRSIRSESA